MLREVGVFSSSIFRNNIDFWRLNSTVIFKFTSPLSNGTLGFAGDLITAKKEIRGPHTPIPVNYVFWNTAPGSKRCGWEGVTSW